MYKTYLNNNIFKKETLFLISLYLTLLISFFFGENSTGGAILDYQNQKNIAIKFSENFTNSFLNYESFTTRHSPILIVFLSFFEKLNIPDISIRLIHLHICLFLPLIFYKCLFIKFKNIDKNILLLLSALLFISPTFRSLSIWPDSRLAGLILFSSSILFYLKFFVDKKFLNALLNVFLCAASAYLSPNFAIFSIFFFYKFLSYYRFFSKEIIYITIFNIILSMPALYYIFALDINFLNKPATIERQSNEIFFVNIFNDILITFSIIFFYLIPFLFLKIIKIEKYITIKNFFFSIIIFVICVFNFDYNISYSGGGIFLKASQFLFKNNYFFYFISFLAILLCLPLIFKDKFNFILFLLIILNNPQYTIYHKYFDPFLVICYFTIFSFSFDINKIKLRGNYLFVFFYFFGFLIINNLKFLWKI